jgi:hypothetical protein
LLGLFAPAAPAIRLPLPATVSVCERHTDRCVTEHLAAARDLSAFLDHANAGVRDAELRIEFDPGRHTANPGLHLDGRALPARIRSVTITGGVAGTQLVGSLPLQIIDERELDEPGESVSANLPISNSPPFRPSQLTAENPGPFVPFDDIGAFELARWPPSGWAPFTADESAANARALKPADTSRMQRWAREPAAWLWGFLKYDWHAEHRGLSAIDSDTGRIVLAEQPIFGMGATGRFRLMNLRSEFDAPREYWIDASQGRLHMRPVPGTLASLRVATAVEPLVRLSHVHDLTLRDLALGETRGHAIVVEQSTDVVIENVRVYDVGRSAILVEGGQDVAILGADIDGTGQHAVVLSGGDRETLRASRHRIERSRIRRASQIVMTPSAAVRLLGVGQIVRNNSIEDSPHMGIYFDGNDHLIEGNRIRRVCLDVNDAGAIYAGRDWTFRGNVIRDNLVADISRGDPRGNLSAIYLDDMLSGVAVERNLLINVPHGILIGGGRDNLVQGNVFVRVTTPVHVDQRALEWARDSVSIDGSMRVRLRRMPYRGRAWRSAYPQLAEIDANMPAEPRGNVVADNCQWKSGPMSVVELAYKSGRIERPLTLDDTREPAGIESTEGVADTCREHIRLSKDSY